MYPSYLNSANNGNLKKISSKINSLLKSCSLCPRKCGINRLKGEKGYCRTANMPRVCSYLPHHGEEPPISGINGSGTIFFSGCTLSCIYCQNFQFSQLDEGKEVTIPELSGYMLELQNLGCHNLNLVTPGHVLPFILEALLLAIPKGLKIPIVYNTSGWELAQIIQLLDGIVDIYLTDMRYGDSQAGQIYSDSFEYPRYNQEAVKEMHRQVGLPSFNQQEIIQRGLIIRHLVLPNDISKTAKIMEFISKDISQDAYISLMSQYTPYYKAKDCSQLNRRLTYEEYEKAKVSMANSGLANGWTQDSGGLERFAGINIKPIHG